MATSEPRLAARVDALMTDAWVLAAFASAVNGEPLSEEHGAVLGAAGLAERVSEGWRLRPDHRAELAGRPDADAFPGRIGRILRQAADAAEGVPARPDGDDDAVFTAEGRNSGAQFGEYLDLLAARLPGVGGLLRSEGLRFLDVGTGIGAIAAEVAARVPGARAVGIDVQPRALRLAAAHLAERRLDDRVELRLEDVAALTDAGAYDLAWLPLSVIGTAAAAEALPRIRGALRPGGLLISATALRGAPEERGTRREAVLRWRVDRMGSTPWDAGELAARLVMAGYVDVQEVRTPPHAMALVVARAPH
ncbi:SAM-dependent methyltransferase [Murinocardiopsis flavida]|nr:class I SAM-dependent methyltransferase [Murinocardiopsis flavida]